MLYVAIGMNPKKLCYGNLRAHSLDIINSVGDCC